MADSAEDQDRLRQGRPQAADRARSSRKPRSRRVRAAGRGRRGRRRAARSRTSPAKASRNPTRKNRCSAPSPSRCRARPPTRKARPRRTALRADGDDKPGGPQQRREVPQVDDTTRYHAFTTQFDEIVSAEDLCDPDELNRLRQQLDQQLSHLQGVVSKLANRLQRYRRRAAAPGNSTSRKASWMPRG